MEQHEQLRCKSSTGRTVSVLQQVRPVCARTDVMSLATKGCIAGQRQYVLVVTASAHVHPTANHIMSVTTVASLYFRLLARLGSNFKANRNRDGMTKLPIVPNVIGSGSHAIAPVPAYTRRGHLQCAFTILSTCRSCRQSSSPSGLFPRRRLFPSG